MKRAGFCDILRVGIFLVLIFSSAAAYPNTINNSLSNPGHSLVVGAVTPPIFTDTFSICAGQTVEDTILIPLSCQYDSLASLTVVEGDGTLIYGPGGTDTVVGYYRFTPNDAGTFPVTYLTVDKKGDSAYYYYQYVVFMNHPPTVGDLYLSDKLCDLGDSRQIQLTATDPENDPLTFTLLQGPGSIDQTGLLTYTPDTSGVFKFKVEVSDECGADTANVFDTLKLNTPPQVTCSDTTVYLCEPEQICFGVNASDPDGDQLQILKLEGLGTFTQLTNTTGEACFMPGDVDSARYMFVFRALDSCLLSLQDKTPECCKDTAWVTVVINRPPMLTCPGPQEFFACDTGTFCFDISAEDPENDALTYAVLSGNATIEGQTVCLSSEQEGEIDVMISVSDECGHADTCTVPVTIRKNHAPVATSADDFAVAPCTTEAICFHATADDQDFNIASITTNIGTYDPETNRICFTPDTSGVYEVTLTVTDSCGLSSSATTAVTVTKNVPPTISLGDDFSTIACGDEPVCVTPEVSDNNLTRVTTNFSYYNTETGQICFTPDTAGVYTLAATAIDDCGAMTTDTVLITVTRKPAPFVHLSGQTDYTMCNAEPICVSVDAVQNYMSLTSNIGEYNAETGSICFTPDSAGTYKLIATVMDSCGVTAVDSISINVDLNQAPTISNFNDTLIYLCAPQMVCIPATVSDPNGNLQTITVNRGSYTNGSVCFVPYDSGNYKIVVTATDSCGARTVDTAVVRITTDQSVNIVVPHDTTLNVCELDTLCFPVSGIPGNAQVSVQGINTWYNAENSTICYYAECSSANKITLSVTTPCKTYKKSFTVTVNCNTAPLVILPPDSSISFCEQGEICIPVGVSDPNHNLMNVTAEGGVYNPTTSTICFTPDTSGVYRISVTAMDSCEASDSDEMLVTVHVNRPPVCSIPGDTTISLCEPGRITLPVSASDADGNLVGCQIIDGPGALIDGNWVFDATTDDSVTVTIQCSDSCGASCQSNFTVKIHVNQAPQCVLPQDQTIIQCAPAQVMLPVSSVDPDNDPVTCTIVHGPGQLIDGNWVYTPEGNESVTVDIRCTDPCGAFCEGQFTVQFRTNHPPVVNTFDSTVYLCDVQEICFDITAHDQDGDPIVLGQGEGPGQFEQLTDSTGRTCFTPEDVDSATYVFVYCATDSCSEVPGRYIPPACSDTVRITVMINRPPQLVCPESQQFFTCGEDNFCFDVTATDPEGGHVTYSVLSGNATVDGNKICVTGTVSDTLFVEIQAMDDCGHADTCTVPVYIDANRPPVVTAAEDYSVSLCGPQQVCFDASVSDPDGNLDSVALNYGTFNSADGQVCFQADTAGVYTITITGIDSCGASSAATTLITVDLNQPPVVNLGQDQTLSLCGPSPVCVQTLVTDKNLANVTTNIGNYTAETGLFCFTADTSGTYRLILTATDECEVSTTDTVYVTVIMSQGPFVALGDDFSTSLCEPGQLCVPVQTVSNPSSITVSPGATYNAETKELCVQADTAGVYHLSMTVTDSCQLSATDDINVTVRLNHKPQIAVHMPDTTVYLCSPQVVKLPFSGIDQDGNIASVTSNRGSYQGGFISFVPYDSGQYVVIATVTDSCGAVAKDTAYVNVKTDQSVNIVVPHDTTIFVCSLDTMCFPVSGIPANGTVQISGVNTWYNAQAQTICFYPECGLSNKITLTVTTPCSTFKKSFTVTVRCNTAPLVIFPPDTTITICEPTSVCIPVGVSDVDHNLGAITAQGGTYNAATSRVCFNADTTGTYRLSLTATDACGAVDSDEILVHIRVNTPPVITYTPADTTYKYCGNDSVCIPMSVTDAENNIVSITTTRGTYHSQSHELCFTPDSSGQYCIVITAVDACGRQAVDTACVSVDAGSYVEFTCPEPITAVPICAAGQVCVPLAITGVNYTVQTTSGSYSNGTLCFNADTSGTYRIGITAAAECNVVSCQVAVIVTIKDPVQITCPGAVDTLLCSPDTVALAYQVSSTVETVTASAPAYVQNGQVFVPVLASGTYQVMMIASGQCGSDTCMFSVKARLNSKPTVVGRDSTMTVCVLDTVCIPFTSSDIDTNLVGVSTNIGQVHGNEVCFKPAAFGLTSIILTATDECGAQGKDTLRIRVNSGGIASIICPGDQYATLCGPDTVRVSVPVSPSTAHVRIFDNGALVGAPYNIATGILSLYVTQSGNHTIQMIADDMCGSDTCGFVVHADIAQPAVVTSPASIDTMLCLAAPDTFCFPVTVTGTGVQVTVKPAGEYTAGYVCYPVSQAGTYNVQIIAQNNCAVDTSTTVLHITANPAPVLHLPTGLSFDRCPDDTESICIDGIFATDNRAVTSLVKVCGPGTFTPARVDSGRVCFVPTEFGTQLFCFEVSDGCTSVTDTMYVDINEKADCDVCTRVTIDGGECTPVGVQHTVTINVESNDPIGGFDLLMSFDASVMAFSSASINSTAITEWEYFTYHLGNAGCGSACPSGLIRLVAIADVNNGAHHPPVSSLSPNGILVYMQYLISNDQNLGDQFLPINFVWYDCGDNTFSDPSGSLLYMDKRIYNYEHTLLWDEDDNANFPSNARPYSLGALDVCLSGASSAPVRCAEFVNGGICVIHPDSIDARGDINLNNIPYEIADAVLYSNYFVYGLKVFKINLAGQIAASDVNGDGLTLSVSDLVLLLRIINGDASGLPKLVPYDQPLTLSTAENRSDLVVSSESPSDIGGALLVYDLPAGVQVDPPRLTSEASDMDMMYDVVDGQLRILLYSMSQGRVKSGNNELLEIPYHGDGRPVLSKSEFVDYQGRPYRVVAKGNSLPTGFELSQNYPNPFNPTTTIEMSLPIATDWSLAIYNINGSLVKRFTGESEAGVLKVEWDGTNAGGSQVASGVYMYRFEAGNFSDTKKMILLK